MPLHFFFHLIWIQFCLQSLVFFSSHLLILHSLSWLWTKLFLAFSPFLKLCNWVSLSIRENRWRSWWPELEGFRWLQIGIAWFVEIVRNLIIDGWDLPMTSIFGSFSSNFINWRCQYQIFILIIQLVAKEEISFACRSMISVRQVSPSPRWIP